MGQNTPSAPGTWLYTPDMPGASAMRVDVLRDRDVLLVRLVDPDGDVELYPVDDLSGTWAPAT
jgi:hypothetical protein